VVKERSRQNFDCRWFYGLVGGIHGVGLVGFMIGEYGAMVCKPSALTAKPVPI
jgi:hypothetical protein